ncbi:MAG: NTP transferase domain-containing protein [Gemmatimonadota bacterium]
MIELGVILAAGAGTRLHDRGQVPHKALIPVGGEPLIVRNCRLLREAGIRRVVVVTGYGGPAVRDELTRHCGGTLDLAFVDNPQWQQPNGLSVLAAAPLLDGDYLLLMADHLFEAGFFTGLAAAPLAADEVVLAIDRKLDRIFDMDDATVVKTAGDRIVAIGKELDDFDAVDTGLFACSGALIPALESQAAQGRASLSAGGQYLADRGRMRGHDIGGLWWQDVDTPGALLHAHELLRAGVS